MCIVFLYSGCCDGEESDYSFILASNRDEFYTRPAKDAAPWAEDANVIGARGKIVKDFLSSNVTVKDHIEYLKEFYAKETNEFIFVTADFRKPCPIIQTYNNVTNSLETWSDTILGFSNSLPDTPLKKVAAGKRKMEEICRRLNKISKKEKLVEELIELLRWGERHLPDPELQRRNPPKYEQLSSVFVSIPEVKYGTRTHTLVLVTKSGHADFIEITMQPPINFGQPEWKKTEFQFQL